MRVADGEGIGFVYGKGKHKPELQKLYEELEECGTRLMEYKEEAILERIQALKKHEFSRIASSSHIKG